MRIFSFTLHYYSPRAYEYLRSVFNCNLPATRTLRYWLSSIDNSSGFTENSLNALRTKAEAARTRGEELIVSLIYDEMYIRRHSQWDKNKKEFLGHIAAGRPEEYEEFSPLSKDVLVLMVSGISQDFKIPIAYFSQLDCMQKKKQQF